MTTVPCRHIPGRVHHGACECFRGGEAGEWPHEERQGVTGTRQKAVQAVSVAPSARTADVCPQRQPSHDTTGSEARQ